MKKVLYAIICFVCALNLHSEGNNMLKTVWGDSLNAKNVWNVYPRPQMKRMQWKNLNGYWQYAITCKDAEQPKKWDGKILVPYPIESQLSGVQKRVGADNALWYKHTFKLPPAWKHDDLLLHFGGVDWKCEIWVNGIHVGGHTGCYAPFNVNVTKAMKHNGVNEIVMRVYDPTDKGFQPRGKQVEHPEVIWYTPVTGIWQTVWLEPVPKTRITDFKLVPDVDNKLFSLNVAVNGDTMGVAVLAKVFDGKKEIARSTLPKRCGDVKMPDDIKLWSPDSPFLYDVEISIIKDGKVLDMVSSYAAMRKISSGKDSSGIVRLRLNDKDIFHLGPLDQGYWPDGLYTAPSYEALVYDVDLTKKLGFNMIRKHVKTEPAVWYAYCDSVGIMVWQDMPSSEGQMRWQPDNYFVGHEEMRTPESDHTHRTEWKEIMNYLYNFPSITVWIPFNEGWGQYDTKNYAEWTKQYDPSRLVNAASGGNLFPVGDMIDVHNYPEPRLKVISQDRANVIGEYGGIGYDVPGHLWAPIRDWGYNRFTNGDEVAEEYERCADLLFNLAKIGCSGAVYTQTTDLENETNGFVTYDRKIVKMDIERIRKANRRIIETFSK